MPFTNIEIAISVFRAFEAFSLENRILAFALKLCI